MYLGQNINYLRKRAGVTQNDLADKLGVTPTQISKYGSGKSSPPVEKIILISEIFDVNIEDLILKDLSQEAGRPAEKAPQSKEEEEEMVNTLNKLLLKRVKILEDHIKKTDPELAERWGIE